MAQSGVISPIPKAFRIDIVGSDAAKIAHNLTTNDVLRLQPGESTEAFFTNVRGQVIGHAILRRATNGVVAIGLHPEPETLCAHTDRYIIMEDGTVQNRTDDTVNFLVVDATDEQVASLVESLPTDVPSPDQAATSDWLMIPFPLETRAWWITGPADDLSVVESVERALGARRLREAEWESLRVTAQWPLMGAEILEKTLPQELGRTAEAISFTKGCYLGQETVARLDARGQLQKRLCRIELPADASVAAGDTVWSGDHDVGQITSVARSRDGSKTIALAYLKRGYFDGDPPLKVQGHPGKLMHRQQAIRG